MMGPASQAWCYVCESQTDTHRTTVYTCTNGVLILYLCIYIKMLPNRHDAHMK